MHHRMLMQFYDVLEDSDIGFHYILFIPDTKDYEDDFYDSSMLLPVDAILNQYNITHRKMDEKRKEMKLKPGDLKEYGRIITNDEGSFLQMYFTIENETICRENVPIRYPINELDINVHRILQIQSEIARRIKVGGLAIVEDAYSSGLYHRAVSNPQVTYAKMKIGTEHVRIPLYKSMFQGMKPDDIKLSICETTLKGIYQYTIQIDKDHLIDHYLGYIVNF